MEYLRAFELKLLAPTNHRGTRLKITDLRATNADNTLYKSIILNYDYSCNTTTDQALQYFKKIGIKINHLIWDSKKDQFILTTNDFITQLKKERG
tara:strand:- start:3625 stop:3909 length:285 start_codon:yes stop_codon:yes gene_type:complete